MKEAGHRTSYTARQQYVKKKNTCNMGIIYAWKMVKTHKKYQNINFGFLRVVGWWFLLYIFFRFPNYILNMLFMLTKAAKPTVFLKPSWKALIAPAMWAVGWVPMKVVLTPLMHRASVNILCSHRTLIDPQKNFTEWTKGDSMSLLSWPCPWGHFG